MPIKVFAVHGIATPSGSTQVLRWEQALKSHGLDVRFTPGRWHSKDIPGDVASVLASKTFRDAQVRELGSQLHGWLATLGNDQGLILAHSMGQPLMFKVLSRRPKLEREQLYKSGVVPIVTMGGPLSNPIFAAALNAAGLGDDPDVGAVVAFWNRDDYVCTPPSGQPSHPRFVDPIRIAVPSPLPPWAVDEHDGALYLGHSIVGAWIRNAIGPNIS
jgi:hypothetical protein